MLAAAGAVSAIAVAFVDHVVKHENPALEVTRVKTSAWLLGAAFPSSPYIAAAAAGATVVRLFVGRRWGHALWLAVAFIAAFRLFAGANVPLDIVIAGGVGWFVGTAAALVFGAPDHRPTAHEVAESLAGCGLPVARLVPAAVDARGSTPWFATTTDGSPLFVKALGRDERDADLLFRIYRFFRLKNVGDQRPFSSLRRAVEHEALVALKARDSGIRTPRVRNVATVGPDGMLLAYDAIEGTSIDSITEYDDDLLEQIWQQVAILRRERIAHRDLRRANIFREHRRRAVDHRLRVQRAGRQRPAAAGRRGRAAGRHRHRRRAGAGRAGRRRRARQGAGRGLAGDAAAAGIGRRHPQGDGRAEGPDGRPADRGARRQTGVTDVQLEPLARVRPRTVLILVSSLIALYVLIPQLTDVGGMVRQLGHASWGWVGATLLFSFLSYIGASISLMGLAPTHVPAFDAFEVCLSGSFVNRITPAGVGGIGLNVRYLQKRGADTAVARVPHRREQRPRRSSSTSR